MPSQTLIVIASLLALLVGVIGVVSLIGSKNTAEPILIPETKAPVVIKETPPAGNVSVVQPVSVPKPIIRLIMTPVSSSPGVFVPYDFTDLLTSRFTEIIGLSNSFRVIDQRTTEWLAELQRLNVIEKDYLKVSTKGSGTSREDALLQAQKNAVEMVAGFRLNSKLSTLKSMEYDGYETRIYTAFDEVTEKQFSGTVKRYEILSEGVDYQNHWVTISAEVELYTMPKLSHSARYVLMPNISYFKMESIDVYIGGLRAVKRICSVTIDLVLLDLDTRLTIPIRSTSASAEELDYESYPPRPQNELSAGFAYELASITSHRALENLLSIYETLDWSANIVMLNGNLYIDKGALDGVKRGMTFAISRDIYPIFDNNPDRPLGYVKENVGTVIITDIQESVARFDFIEKLKDVLEGDKAVLVEQF
ncbi:hypothetical protein [uncultured Mesotoga sp.]|uniref:hypothetical protein n=1 Tax=uncultured Mesotoga sp. TaxID=1184400 RepID=UPI002598CD11|nr:hypothetical protein [uncultured Mesotoga sp.]